MLGGRQLIKFKTTSFLMAGTVKMGTMIKERLDIEVYNICIDQVQFKYDDDYVVFSGYLTEFHVPFFQQDNGSDYGTGSDFLQ